MSSRARNVLVVFLAFVAVDVSVKFRLKSPEGRLLQPRPALLALGAAGLARLPSVCPLLYLLQQPRLLGLG